MGLTQNYYNWIKVMKFGSSSDSGAGWSTLPTDLKVKMANGDLRIPALYSNSITQFEPFVNIWHYATANATLGHYFLIPSKNNNEENINDYITSKSFIDKFSVLGADIKRTVDFTNNTSTVKEIYRNKTTTEQTVYGVELISIGSQLGGSPVSEILFCRKKFNTPIVVKPNDAIELSLTWEVA